MASMILLLTSLVCLTLFADAQNNTRCFVCTDIQHPANCTTVTECVAGQTCVVEQFITSGGLVQFNSGCRSRQICGRRRRRDIPQYSSLSKRSDIITCDQCCDGEFCNNEGCGNAGPKQPERGAMCFQCHSEDRPDTCRHLRKCYLGEVCMLTELPTMAPNGGNLYKTACVSPTICQAYTIIGRRRHTYCHMCCSEDFCNDHCEANMTLTTITTMLPTDTTLTTILPTDTTLTTILPTDTTPTTILPTDTTPTTMLPADTTTTTMLPTDTTTTTMLPTDTTLTTIIPTDTTQTTIIPTDTTLTTTLQTDTTQTTIIPTDTTPMSTTPPRVPTKPPTTMMTSSTLRIITTTRHSTLADVCKHRQYHYDANSHLCYKFHHILRTWDDANTLCKHEGGTLAIINTQLKWDFLKNALKQDSRYAHEAGIYIGGKNTGSSHVYTWVDGSSVQFAEWASGEPDGHHSNCIYLIRTENYQWHDRSCKNSHVFVCSMQM